MMTAYHPKSNGMVERFHWLLEAALRAWNCGMYWVDHLPWVMLGLQAAPKDDTGVSPAELVYWCKQTLLGELLRSSKAAIDNTLTAPSPPPPHDMRLGKRRWPERPGGEIPLSLRQALYMRRGYCGQPLTPIDSGPYEVVT
jgi:hypothetical protein